MAKQVINNTNTSPDSLYSATTKMNENFTELYAPTVVSLTDASTIAVNVDLGKLFKVTLGGNRTLGNPTGTIVDGQLFEVRVRQDGAGTRTLAYDTQYRFGTDITQPTLTTAINKTDYLLFQYHSTDIKWDCISVSKGY